MTYLRNIINHTLTSPLVGVVGGKRVGIRPGISPSWVLPPFMIWASGSHHSTGPAHLALGLEIQSHPR